MFFVIAGGGIIQNLFVRFLEKFAFKRHILGVAKNFIDSDDPVIRPNLITHLNDDGCIFNDVIANIQNGNTRVRRLI